MKIKIRKSLFETNSSSIHSICIPKNSNISESEIEKKYTSVFLKRDVYGWGPYVLDTFEEKANYIYEMCLARDLSKDLLVLLDDGEYGDKKIMGFGDKSCTWNFICYLSDKGIETSTYKGRIYDGGIDHDFCWGNTIEEFLSNPKLLDSILFDFGSFIYIDNDNHYEDDEPLRIIDETKYNIWYKYN